MDVKCPLSHSFYWFICNFFTFITIPVVGDLAVCHLTGHQVAELYFYDLILVRGTTGCGGKGRQSYVFPSRRAALRKL